MYPVNMLGPAGVIMTREKLISREEHQKSPTYGRVTELFLESEFQHKSESELFRIVYW